MIPSSAEMESLRTLRNGRMVMRTHHLKNHMSTRVIYPLHVEKVTNYCINLAHKRHTAEVFTPAPGDPLSCKL